MVNDEATCKRCIHKQVCIARSSYDSVVNTWNEQYPFVQMNLDGDSIAKACLEYRTLTDIHMIEKPNMPEPEPQAEGKPSRKFHYPPS